VNKSACSCKKEEECFNKCQYIGLVQSADMHVSAPNASASSLQLDASGYVVMVLQLISYNFSLNVANFVPN
jgi:hypothetical protein